jgi:hypothetical protein
VFLPIIVFALLLCMLFKLRARDPPPLDEPCDLLGLQCTGPVAMVNPRMKT